MNTSRFTDTRRWFIGIAATAFTMILAFPAHAGVTTDGTLGQGGTLALILNGCEITVGGCVGYFQCLDVVRKTLHQQRDTAVLE